MFDRGNHCGPFGTHHPIGDKQDQAVQQVETVGHLSQYDRCRPFKQAIEGIPTGNDQKRTCQEQDGRQGVGRRKAEQNRRQTRDRDSSPDTLAEGSPDGSNTCQTCRGNPSRECIQHRCPHLGHHHSQRHHRRHTEQHPDQRSRCPHTECTERETGIEQPFLGQRPHRSSQRDRFSKPIDRRYPGDGEHQPGGYLPEYDGGRFLPFKTGTANRYQDHACDREQIERSQSKQTGQIQPRPVNRLLAPIKHLGPKQKPRDHEK